MQKLLKQIRRKLFGLDEQEAAFQRAIADTNELIATANNSITNLQQSLDSLHHNYSRALIEVVAQSQPQSVLSCMINGMPLRVPAEILRSYSHCLELSQKFSLNYCVESHCVQWLSQHLETGDVFIDIGAAYGVVSLPLSSVLGSAGHIYAFEPARQTRHLLEQLLQKNQPENITIVPKAIADEVGTAEFIEYSSENYLSWASDASTLAANVQPSQKHYQTYSVEITTIDKFVSENSLHPKAIKIDIEGFELYALQGGKAMLKRDRPYLCIDIHNDVKTNASALLGVQPLLENLGYHCQMEGHTLFASPQRQL